MSAQRYSGTAILLHWAIAILLAFQLALGWNLENIPKGPPQFAAFQLHKSVGLSILLLSLVRLAIRVLRPRPAAIADSLWAVRAAKAVHWGFYTILIVGPLSGWVLVSTARIKVPTLVFGVVPWPHLPIASAFHEPAESVHELLAWSLLGLFLLHVAGALRHQFIKDENLVERMIPFLTAPGLSKRRAGIAVAIALFALWMAHGAGWQAKFGSAPQAETRQQAHKPEIAIDRAIAPPAPDPEPAVTPGPVQETVVPQAVADWRVAPGGVLGFRADWAGNPVSGRFSRWRARIRFSPDEPRKTRIRVAVDLASVDTSDSQSDDSLKSSDFFNIAAYPEALFTADHAQSLGGERYRAKGMLCLHGQTRAVSLDFTLKLRGDEARVSGTTSLDRTAFGVGSGEWTATDQIAAKVDVNFSFTASRVPAH